MGPPFGELVLVEGFRQRYRRIIRSQAAIMT
jgi:hypothetical protein